MDWWNLELQLWKQSYLSVVVGLGLTTVAVEQIEPVGKIVFGGAKEETDVRKPELGVL